MTEYNHLKECENYKTESQAGTIKLNAGAETATINVGSHYYLYHFDSGDRILYDVKFCPFCGADLKKAQTEHMRMKLLNDGDLKSLNYLKSSTSTNVIVTVKYNVPYLKGDTRPLGKYAEFEIKGNDITYEVKSDRLVIKNPYMYNWSITGC